MTSKREKSPPKNKKTKEKKGSKPDTRPRTVDAEEKDPGMTGSGSSKKLSIDEVWQLARGKRLEFSHDDVNALEDTSSDGPAAEQQQQQQQHQLRASSNVPGLASAGGSATSGSTSDESLEQGQPAPSDDDEDSAGSDSDDASDRPGASTSAARKSGASSSAGVASSTASAPKTRTGSSASPPHGSAQSSTASSAAAQPHSATITSSSSSSSSAGAAPAPSGGSAGAHNSGSSSSTHKSAASASAASAVASGGGVQGGAQQSAAAARSDRRPGGELEVPSLKAMQKSDTLVYESKSPSRPQTTESVGSARSSGTSSPRGATASPRGSGGSGGGGSSPRSSAASSSSSAPPGARTAATAATGATASHASNGAGSASSPRRNSLTGATPASAAAAFQAGHGSPASAKQPASAWASSSAIGAPSAAAAAASAPAGAKTSPAQLAAKRKLSSDGRVEGPSHTGASVTPLAASSGDETAGSAPSSGRRASLRSSSPRVEVSGPVETIMLAESGSDGSTGAATNDAAAKSGARVPALPTGMGQSAAGAAALYDDFPKDLIPSDAVMRATAERPRVPHKLSARSLSAHSMEAGKESGRPEHSRDEEIEGLYAEQDSLRRELERAKAQISKYAVDITTMSWQLQVYKNRFMASKVQPPSGQVTLVFTDVKCSTELWELDPKAMCSALSMHNELLRKLMDQYYGYEIKTEGDAFFVAFASVENALRWSLEVQMQLMKLDWPQSLFAHKFATEERDSNGELIYRGLRLRIGIHSGEPTCVKDPVTHRMDYLGPMVNRAARIAAMAHGGQTVLSQAVWSMISDDKLKHRLGDPVFKTLGKFSLRGLEGDELIIQIAPKSLVAREFPPIDAKPSNVISLESQIEELKKENEALIKRMEELEKGMAAVDANAQRVSNNISLMASQSTEFLDGATAYDEIKKIKKHQEFLTAKLLHMRVNNESLMKQIGTLTKQMGLFATENIKAQEMSATYEAELIQLRITNTKLIAKLDNYKKELSARVLEIAELRGGNPAPAGNTGARPAIERPLSSPLPSPRLSPPSTASSESICIHERQAEDIEHQMEDVLNRYQVKIGVERVITTLHLLGDTKSKVKMINGVLSVQTPFGGYESFENWVARYKHAQENQPMQSPALSTLSAHAHPTRGHTSSGARDRDDHGHGYAHGATHAQQAHAAQGHAAGGPGAAAAPNGVGVKGGAATTELGKVLAQLGAPSLGLPGAAIGLQVGGQDAGHASHQPQQKVLLGSTVNKAKNDGFRPPEGIHGASITKVQPHYGGKPKSAVPGKHPDHDKMGGLKSAPLVINNVPLGIGGGDPMPSDRRFPNLPPLDH